MKPSLEKTLGLHPNSAPLHLDENSSLWLFLEQSPDATVLHVERKIVKVNNAALALVGATSPDQLVGRQVLEFVAPDYHEVVDRRLRQVTEAQKAVPVLEETLLRLDGTESIVEIYSIPITYKGQIGAMSVLRDITEPREMAKKLKLAKEEAEAASQAKTFFLAKMSHELRTPLHGLIGMLELLFESGPTPQQIEHLSLAFTSSQALLAVISDLLDISSIESGQVTLDEILFDVEHMVRTIVNTFQHKAEAKGLQLSFTYNAPYLIKSDPIRLWQLLTNLLNNAIKFTERGSVQVAVGCRNETKDSVTLFFAIKDTGLGILETQMERIFEPFYQFDMREETYHEGTGLGLTICRQLVGLMGGELNVESRLGVGSIFTTTLSFKRPTNRDELHSHFRNGRWWWPNTDLPQRLWPNPASDNEDYSRQPRVLLVEDNHVNQKLMRTMLNSYHYKVDVAENGNVAVERAGEIPYDLILMDCQMPELDGFDATRAIRANPSSASHEAPIIAVTAYAMPGDRQRCLDAGMNDYLSKPVRRHALEEVLERWLHADDDEN